MYISKTYVQEVAVIQPRLHCGAVKVALALEQEGSSI